MANQRAETVLGVERSDLVGRQFDDDRKDEIFGKGEYGLDGTGTGIGLYPVYTLVTRFDGDVRVEDTGATGGAAFVVEPPAAEAEDWT